MTIALKKPNTPTPTRTTPPHPPHPHSSPKKNLIGFFFMFFEHNPLPGKKNKIKEKKGNDIIKKNSTFLSILSRLFFLCV